MNGYRLSKMAQREIDSMLDYVAEHSGMAAAGIVRFAEPKSSDGKMESGGGTGRTKIPGRRVHRLLCRGGSPSADSQDPAWEAPPEKGVPGEVAIEGASGGASNQCAGEVFRPRVLTSVRWP